MAVTRIKIPQLTDGTDGELITWNSSGAPTTVAVGTSGHVLTSNGVGAAPTFQAATGAASSGISGAVQFSGGSGTFSSDETNFFFNNTTNQLQLAGGTTYGILVSGSNGGIDASPSASITGAWNAFRTNANATGTINIFLNNTATSQSAANSKLTISTTTTGGDPFLFLSTGNESGYVIGMDNSVSDKLFIGLGADPSTMTTPNITLHSDGTGFMQTSPTAYVHPGPGTVGRAPIKLSSGTALTTPEDGAIEYHTSHLYFTIGSTRYQLDQQSGTLSDGDKGDITVSSSGTVWTIDNLAVTNAKINDVSVAKLTSGNLLGGLTLTLPTSSLLNINYFGASTAFVVSDTSSSASIFSKDGTQYLSTDNTSVLIGSGTTQMEYIDGVLRMYDSDVTQYVGFQTPATGSLTSSYTLTLPTTAGSSGQALTTNGSGTLSWVTYGTGDVTGQSSSVDSEIALFSSTTGKVIKRATGTGVAVVTSGVYSTKTNPSGAFVGTTDTQTLTNKRIDPRVTTTSSSSTPTPDSDASDMYTVTALAAGATFGAPTGTPVQGQKLIIRVKDNGTARTLAYNAIYRAVGITLPTTTVISKTVYLGCIYNSTDTKWDVIAVAFEA